MEKNGTYGISRRGFLGAIGGVAGAFALGRDVFAQETDLAARLREEHTQKLKGDLVPVEPSMAGFRGEYGGRIDIVSYDVNGQKQSGSFPLVVVAPEAPLEAKVALNVINPHGDNAAFPVGWIFRDSYGKAFMREGEERRKAEEGRHYGIWTPADLRAPQVEGSYFFWAVGGPQASVRVEGGGAEPKVHSGFDFLRTMTSWGYGRPVEDGNDIKHWGTERMVQALQRGYVAAPQLGKEGKEEVGLVAARPIVVVVDKRMKQ